MKIFLSSRAFKGLLWALVFGLFALLQTPASMLTRLLPPEMVLTNVQGSIWSGQASALGFNGMVLQEQLTWKFHGAEWLSGRFSWSVNGKFGNKISGLRLVLTPRGIGAESVQLTLPLEPLTVAHPLLKSAQLGAELQVHADSIYPRTSTTAQVLVEGLTSRLTPQNDLGSYRIELQAEATGNGSWRATTTSGTLQVAGQGTFSLTDQKIHGLATLKLLHTLAGISPLLDQLPRNGDGYQVNF